MTNKKNKKNNIKKKIKALLLFSGGLDSILAAELLKRQGVEVKGLCFYTPFFGYEGAVLSARKIGLKLIKKDISKNFFTILAKPKHGYGKNINPCLDCHSFMIRKALGELKKNKAQFLASGEVLGERPFSQKKESLETILKESGSSSLLLRPLSAKLLDKTIPEEKGWVKREKMLDISGRSRKRQIALAKKWGIRNYPTPASGCLLTDPGYSKRLKELIKVDSRIDKNNANLIKYGRLFWLDNILIVVGRNQKDNQKIKKIAQKKDIIMEAKDFAGPLTLVRNYKKYKKIPVEIIKKAGEITGWYGKGRDEKKVIIKYCIDKKDNLFRIRPKK